MSAADRRPRAHPSTLITLERDSHDFWHRASRVLTPLLHNAGPSMAQAATTAALTHFGLGLVATEAGIVAGSTFHTFIHPARMDPAAPDTPLDQGAALVYAAPLTDPACTAGFCLWYPVSEPARAGAADAAPVVHPDQVDTVIPLWFPTADAATRYAATVLQCPLSFTPDPAAAAQAVAAWMILPVADRAAVTLLPDTPWLVTPLTPDGPWMPWRLFTRGPSTVAAVLPENAARLERDPHAPFTDPPVLCATQAEALALLRHVGVVSAGDAVLTYPASALAPYFDSATPPQRRPAPPPVPALSAASVPWPPQAPDPPRRADGTHVWHIVGLSGRGAIAWTVDGLSRIRLAGADPDHPWFWPDPAAAFAAFRDHQLFAAYGQPPVSVRDITRLYPDLLRPARGAPTAGPAVPPPLA